jgi:hypothetical protein
MDRFWGFSIDTLPPRQSGGSGSGSCRGCVGSCPFQFEGGGGGGGGAPSRGLGGQIVPPFAPKRVIQG